MLIECNAMRVAFAVVLAPLSINGSTEMHGGTLDNILVLAKTVQALARVDLAATGRCCQTLP
jgi:hypothetical protein